MATMRIAPTGEQQRAQALLEMGFDATQAILLAATRPEGAHVDLDRVRHMVDGGCEHDLAVRILL